MIWMVAVPGGIPLKVAVTVAVWVPSMRLLFGAVRMKEALL